jgi:hypothetical protein
MPFQVSWSIRGRLVANWSWCPPTVERVALEAALARACELLVAGKAMVTVTRPEGTQLDENRIRNHCAGRRQVAWRAHPCTTPRRRSVQRGSAC